MTSFYVLFFHPSPVEVRHEGGGDGAALLDVAVLYAETACVVDDALVFEGREAAVEFGDVR